MRKTTAREIKKDMHLTRRTMVAAVMIFVFIPALFAVSFFVWDDRKYYLVSSLIILLSAVPFIMKFEKRRPQAREVVILAVMIALAVASRSAFYMLPQFKPVTAIVIITGVAFGGEAGFITGACTAFISNFFFGQGPWTPWQMFGLGTVGFLAGVLFRKGMLPRKVLPLCIFGGFSALVIYGAILDTSSLLMYSMAITWKSLLAVYASGFVFNLIHAASTAFFLLILSKPMLEKLDRVKTKFGLLES